MADLPTMEGAEAVVERLRDEEIDGAALWAYGSSGRTCKELKEDFDISLGKASKLWSAIRELIDGDASAKSPSITESAGRAGGGRATRTEEEGVPPEDLRGSHRAASLRLEPAQQMVMMKPSADKDKDTLRSELSAMKLSQIRKRAVADGVAEEAIEEADDGQDRKISLIELIVQMNSPAD